MSKWFVYIVAITFITIASARRVLELQGVNLELALSTYKYVAVLFYDSSSRSQSLLNAWKSASQNLDDWNEESEMAMINGDDPESVEIIESYDIKLPSIKVFRRGIIAEYRGPTDADGMAQYLIEDSKPSIKYINNENDLKSALQTVTNPVVLSFFSENMIVEDEGSETFSITPWGQFLASSDALRGHASFFVSSNKELFETFKLTSDSTPAIFMFSDDGGKLLQYHGELLESKLSDWILKNSSPTMGELTLSSASGEAFTTQFFSSAKLKFILIFKKADYQFLEYASGSLQLSSTENASDITPIQAWRVLSQYFKSKSLFSYMISDSPTSVADVMEFFSLKPSDLPTIVALDPVNDGKFVSNVLKIPKDASVRNDKLTDHATEVNNQLKDFVVGVLSGVIQKIVKSEPIPKASKGYVVQAVGSTLIDLVSQEGKDVLLEMYAPWCAHCKKLRSTYDILGRSVAADPRIIVAKMDATANDYPLSWNVKSYPTLLWFPAKDKPYKVGKNNIPIITPRPYWDAGFSLHELVSFIQRESSFDMKSLKIATVEQLGQLLSEEESLRQKYEQEERHEKRNEGRELYENPLIDYIFGEVVYDGTRFHLFVVGVLGLISIAAIFNGMLTKRQSSIHKKVPSKKQ